MIKTIIQRVGFLRRFGQKTGIDFAYFGLESGMVFKETTGVYERIYYFNSKWVRKREICEFEMVFSQIFFIAVLIYVQSTSDNSNPP